MRATPLFPARLPSVPRPLLTRAPAHRHLLLSASVPERRATSSSGRGDDDDSSAVMHLGGVLTVSPRKPYASASFCRKLCSSLSHLCPVSFSRDVVLPVGEVMIVDHGRFLDREVCAYMRIEFESQPAIVEVTTKCGAVYTALRTRILRREQAFEADALAGASNH